MNTENAMLQYGHSNQPSSLGLRLKRISWPAMFAGVVTTLVVLFLLSLLGLSVGLGAINPVTDPSPFSGLGTGAIVWWGISNIIALFAGGWVTGRLSAVIAGPERVTNGVVMWGLYTIFSLFILSTSVGAVLGGAGSLMGMVGRETASNTNIDKESITAEIKQLMRETGKPELQPERMEGKAKGGSSSPQAMKNAGKETMNALDRDALVNVVMNRTGKSRTEAEATVNSWLGKEDASGFNPREEQARRTAEETAGATSQAALYSFFALLLGAVAAGLGAMVGRTDPGDDLWLRNERVPVTGPAHASEEPIVSRERTERARTEKY